MSDIVWTYYATVARIVDADTFDLVIDLGFGVSIKERIRLAGVDAWETRGEERPEGLAAKAFVEEVMPVGSVVMIRTDKDRGKYGRYIAEVWYGETFYINLGLRLLKEGHATVYE